MKTTSFPNGRLFLIGLFFSVCFLVEAQLPFKPLSDAPANAEEQKQLSSLFAQARATVAGVQPGPNAGAQRQAMADELDRELESFVTTHTNSMWTPPVRLWLARNALGRVGYSTAMEHSALAWAAVRDANDPAAQRFVLEASGRLARLLAMTGRLSELDALEAQVRQQVPNGPFGGEWAQATEMRRWVRQHPTAAYKCGLDCLDQLGRLTQPGQFRPGDIVTTASTTNGFSAAELVAIAGRVGLRVHAAMLNNLTNPPVPSILHLRSDHFVVLREQRGAFYDVHDPATFGPRWVTATQIAAEASGCVIVSDVAGPGATLPMDDAAAAAYRGRMIGSGWGYGDTPCDGGDSDTGDGCGGSCTEGSGNSDPSGMPRWAVSEPWLNLWLLDTPLSYRPAFGPGVQLRLAFKPRHTSSVVSGAYWHGALLGNYGGSSSQWGCSWLSFAELKYDEYTVDLLLPQGGRAIFTFAAGSSLSTMNFRNRLVLEKQGPSGGITNLVVHFPNGAQTSYGVRDTNDVSYAGLFYMSKQSDPMGNSVIYAYNPGHLLTNVAAADGANFTLHYDEPTLPSYITSVGASYGSTVSFGYDKSSGITNYAALTNITDAAGISSHITYGSAGEASQLITPYGTTQFGMVINGASVFDRMARITLPNGTQEFYGLMNTYGGTTWPDYASGQIPTNTPVGTLDTSARQGRNTFFWNAKQFASYVNTPLTDFDWDAFKKGRIQHWLGNAATIFADPNALSVEQSPSPDGSAEGQLTWYDYAGKPANANEECGPQIMPSVIARVMPDGSTGYQYFERLTNGLPTKAVEKWARGSTAFYRTNDYTYAANNVDMTLHFGPNGEQVSSNVFNAYHQVRTNYDALNQTTTYTYDGTTFQLASITHPTGLTTTKIYNGNHRLQKVIDLEISRTNSYTWYASGNVEGHTSERGLSVTNYWDGLNRLTGTKHPDGTTTSNLYTVGSTKILERTASKDRLGYWSYFGYDALRRKTAETNANGAITRWGYCDCGATAHVTNAWSSAVEFVMQYDYDFQGNRIYDRYPDATVTNWFDALQRHFLTYDAWGGRGFYFDNLNRLTNTSNAYGTEQNTTYDIEDRPIYVTDANGVTITNTYDVLGRLNTRTQPDGGAEKFGYSARGLIAYTNQLDKITYYGYDEARRKIAETNANNEIIRYTNNAAGDLLSLTDGKSQTTKWNYDEYGRVTNKLDQAAVEILRYKYDPDSRLTNRWSIAKTNTYYSYDPVGNLTNVNYPASTDVAFAYDPLNRVTNMVDAAGTTKYAYAAGGQLWTEDGPWSSDTVTNGYLNRLRTSLSLAQPTGRWTNDFGYDAAKRLTNVTSQAGSFAYTYHASRITLLDKLALPNTGYITNTYDTVARLTGTHLKNSTNGTLNSHQYTYNPGNQRTQQVFGVGSTYNYTYDGIGQLTVGDSATASEDRRYVYDAAWNLNYRTNNTTLNTFKVDTRNQLTNATPVGTQAYDGNGNVTSSQYGSQTLTYDDENRLTTNEVTYTSRSVFTYDGLGRLRQREDWAFNGTPYFYWYLQATVRYVYDGMRVIQERQEGNSPLVSYTRGRDLSGSLEAAGGIGGLLARSHSYSGGNWSTHNFYHADGNGNITYLVNSSQTKAAQYRYDPFGNTISQSGTLADANTYRFSSKEIHVNSGLYYYGYRWYAPNLQRWLNTDPIYEWGGINLYQMCLNNTVDYVDPHGEFCPPCAIVLIAIVLYEIGKEMYDSVNPPHPLFPPGPPAPPPQPPQPPQPPPLPCPPGTYSPFSSPVNSIPDISLTTPPPISLPPALNPPPLNPHLPPFHDPVEGPPFPPPIPWGDRPEWKMNDWERGKPKNSPKPRLVAEAQPVSRDEFHIEHKLLFALFLSKGESLEI